MQHKSQLCWIVVDEKDVQYLLPWLAMAAQASMCA